ncbi:MAG: Smr/MutS family protein [Bacteroidota bacterium]
MSQFKVGEKVSFLYEKGGGTIVEIINSKQVRLNDDDGFDQIYNIADLVKIHGTIDKDSIIPSLKDEEISHEKKSNYTVLKDKTSLTNKDFWELDLHIESLTDNHRGMSNFEIMKIQMNEFKRFYSKAKANQINKIVIIHGVGEGILKNEIRSYLDQQEFVQYHDASYLEYGKGATEVLLNKKW